MYYEVKIIHIIVQNNTYYSARSRWTKQQQCQQHKPLILDGLTDKNKNKKLGRANL